MQTQEQLADQFEEHRDHLRSVAYRMLGSVAEADDAVQDAWLRLARADTDDVVNLRGWLTTVVSRICLDMLRSRKSRREDSLEFHFPDPVVTRLDADPASSAEQADAVTLALLVVLDTLNPRERMAFVLHDMFGVPFDAIGEIVGSTPATATQLASRARRRVRATPPPVADLATQRQVLHAFTSAAERGDFEVASQASAFRRTGHEPEQTWVLVNGAVGLVSGREGVPIAVFCPVIRGNRIVEINILTDPDRIATLDLSEVL
jgi:RNA polymerase sigma factor (sigma-70 family)